MLADRAVTFVAMCCAGCGAAGGAHTDVAATTAPQAEIEPTPDAAGVTAKTEPIGEGDEAAERCFAAAAVAAAGNAAGPCSLQAPAACTAPCRGGDLGACRQLGVHFADSDAPEAAGCAEKILSLACERKHLLSCSQLAALLLDGSPEQQTQARELLKRACSDGHGPACTRLGKALAADEDLDERAEVTKQFERGCSLGDADGCAAAADHYNRGDGVALDFRRGVELSQRACELGHSRGCLELATSVMLGRGVNHDMARAMRLLEVVCRSDDASTGGDGCFMLAQQLGPSPSAAGAGARRKQLFARACTKGNVNACTEVVTAHFDAGQYAEAIALSDKLIAKHPDIWLFRFARGMSLFDSGRHREAIDDLQALAELRRDWHYPQLWLYAARMRAGIDGKPQLDRASQLLLDTSWTAQIFKFFLGKLSANKLLRAAKHSNTTTQLEQQCEAYFYIAQQLMVGGRSRQARSMLQKSVDTGISSFVEYDSARAELARMANKTP